MVLLGGETINCTVFVKAALSAPTTALSSLFSIGSSEGSVIGLPSEPAFVDRLPFTFVPAVRGMNRTLLLHAEYNHLTIADAPLSILVLQGSSISAAVSVSVFNTTEMRFCSLCSLCIDMRLLFEYELRFV